MYQIRYINFEKNEYKFYKNDQEIILDIDPYINKLFNNDIFIIEDNIIKILESETRKLNFITGILILEDNKSYGKNNKKFLYKCIPYDKKLPYFLIPYQMKVGFNKNFKNIYILFSFDSWLDKHPYAICKEKINDYIDYKLYCYNLHKSPTKCNIKEIKFPNNIKIRSEYIFTIDNIDTTDYDDAVSIQPLDLGYKVSIYISNVAIILDLLNLYPVLGDRVSTIYLPNKKISMLPTILSDNFCSLKEKEERIAFTMDIFIIDNHINNIVFSNNIIIVNKNYKYEESNLLKNKNYILLFNIIKQLDNKINDSHTLIAYLMILMNHECSKKINKGIYRSTIPKESLINFDLLSNEIKENIKLWYTNLCIYTDKKLPHNIMNLESYIHITSPIRRIVDLLNMIELQKNLGLYDISYNFHDLDYINKNFKLINKLQKEAYLLSLDYKDKIYDGYIINEIKENKYNVYIPEIKLFSTVKVLNKNNLYNKQQFRVFVFNTKIRLEIIYTMMN